MTCVGRCKLSDDRCDGLGVPESLRYEIYLAGWQFCGVSCRVELTMTGPGSCVYLGVPVDILPSR